MLERIREICAQKGLTIKELEKQAGLGTNTIFKWDYSSPSINKVRAVSDVLGVTVNDLLDYDGIEDPEAVLLVQELATRPELKVLFMASRKASKEDIEAAARLLDRK